MANSERKQQLIAEIERARYRATAYRQQMRGSRPSVTSKAEAKIARNRYPWLLGSLLTGFVIAKLPARTKKVVVNRNGERQLPAPYGAGKTGLSMGLLKIGIDLAKPIMMAWLTKRLGEAVQVGKTVEKKVDKVDRKT